MALPPRLLVVALLSTMLPMACRQASEPAPASPDSTPVRPSPSVVEPFTGVWPFDRAEEALAWQLAVDAGRRAWALDPARVSARYARSVLRWGFPEVRQADPHTFEITDPGSGAIVTVQVGQPVSQGEGGVWAITRVDEVSGSDLPSAVAETRNALLAATAAGDYDALRPLIDLASFTYSFGDGGDPIAFWKDIEANSDERPLEILATILSMPFAQTDGAYAWPFAFHRDPASLTDDELRMLSALYPNIERDVDSWIEFGGYFGWRTGISPDGTWLFFVAGD
ncbi:MAG TPA: hypothetical protein VGA93_07715 [Actinomycetota bacterium]